MMNVQRDLPLRTRLPSNFCKKRNGTKLILLIVEFKLLCNITIRWMNAVILGFWLQCKVSQLAHSFAVVSHFRSQLPMSLEGLSTEKYSPILVTSLMGKLGGTLCY
jgi:hypothetical protein